MQAASSMLERAPCSSVRIRPTSAGWKQTVAQAIQQEHTVATCAVLRKYTRPRLQMKMACTCYESHDDLRNCTVSGCLLFAFVPLRVVHSSSEALERRGPQPCVFVDRAAHCHWIRTAQNRTLPSNSDGGACATVPVRNAAHTRSNLKARPKKTRL